VKTTAWAVALCLTAVPSSAQEVPVFSTGTEVVRLDVAAIRDGKPVAGLHAADFEVRDNGVVQTVEVIGDADGSPDKPVDAVLALDVSDSVRGESLVQLKAAAHGFVDLLRPEDSFSLLTFSSRVRLVVSPSDSRAHAHEVIETTRAQLTTALYDAAFAAVVVPDARRGHPLALVLSDGEDRGSWLKGEQVLRAAEGEELVVHVVFTGTRGNQPPFLSDLAATTGGQVWRADYGQLRDVLRSAVEEFRSRYTLRYERKGVKRAGWHELDIRVRQPGIKVRARNGYVEE
jgi:VWFA-related protein